MGARGPLARPKLVVNQGRSVSRPTRRKANRPKRMPPVVKEMDKGKVLPVMLYPPVPLPQPAADWYGRLVRRRARDDQEPLLKTHLLRREDSLMVMTLAKMLAELDRGFSRLLAKDCNDLMAKLGCSPAARERVGAAADVEEPRNEFAEF